MVNKKALCINCHKYHIEIGMGKERVCLNNKAYLQYISSFVCLHFTDNDYKKTFCITIQHFSDKRDDIANL